MSSCRKERFVNANYCDYYEQNLFHFDSNTLQREQYTGVGRGKEVKGVRGTEEKKEKRGLYQSSLN